MCRRELNAFSGTTFLQTGQIFQSFSPVIHHRKKRLLWVLDQSRPLYNPRNIETGRHLRCGLNIYHLQRVSTTPCVAANSRTKRWAISHLCYSVGVRDYRAFTSERVLSRLKMRFRYTYSKSSCKGKNVAKLRSDGTGWAVDDNEYQSHEPKVGNQSADERTVAFRRY